MPITYYPTFKNSSGNVGIGNINPSYRLDVKATTTNGSTVFVIRNANDSNNTVFYDNGTVSAGSDFRAPIFYDTNNTAYYIDAAGTSVLSALTIGGNTALTTASTLTAGNLSGTIPSGVLGNSTHYIGTTAIALNRGSSSQTLTGVSIDGNAATVTNGVYTTGAQTIAGTKTFSDGIVVNTAAYNTFGKPSPAAYQTVTLFGSTSGGLFFTTDNPIIGTGAYYNNGWIATATSGRNIDFGSGNFSFTAFSGATVGGAASFGTVAQLSNAGVFSAIGDFRAPIFYDSDNTAYYINAASTSNLVGLTVANTITGAISGNAGTATTLATARTLTIGSTGKTFNGSADVSWSTTEIVGYTPAYGTAAYQTKSLDTISTPGLYQYDGAFGGTKPPDNAPNYRTIEIGSSARFSQVAMPWNSDGYYFRRYDGTSFSTWRTVLHDGNYNSYAPTLTGTGASGTWAINSQGIYAAGAAYIKSTSTGTSYTSHIQVREADGGVSSTNEIYAPALGFHWAGVVASNILMESSGRIAIRNNPGSSYENFIANIVYGNSSVQTPILYDSNNTSYYIDPASTSVLNGLTVGGESVLTQTSVTFTPNGVGWYRILTAGGISSGTIRISGFYDNRSATVEFDYTVNGWGNQCYATVRNNNNYSIGLITQIRVSNDGGSSANCYLDIYIASSTTPGALTITNFGPIKGGLVSSPVVGATAGTSNVKTISINNVMGVVTTGVFNGASSTISGAIYLGDATTYISQTTSPYLRITTANGYGEFGPANSSWFHMQTDRPNFYMATGLHVNGNIFVYNTQSQLTSTSVRAPIFYDSDNTAYYVDPASTSVINALSVSTLNNINAANGTWHTSAEGQGRFYFASSGNTFFKTGNNFIFRNTSDSGVLTIDGSGNLRTTSGGDNYASYSLHVGGTGYASSDFRAPIFYDSNNTAYYTDPASTSVLNRLTIDGGNYAFDYFQSLSDFTNGTLVTTDIPATAANGLSFVMNVVGKSYNTTTSPFNFSVQGYLYNSTIINYSGLSLDSTGLTTIKIFENGGYLCFWWARVSYWNAFEVSVRSYDTAKTNYNRVTNITDAVEPTGTKKVTVTLQTFLRADVSATNAVDLRAPIFYDSNDTAYYCDPNSVSRLSSLRVYSAFDTASSDVYANMRVMRNNATTDGMYIGYGNSGTTSALTRIFGGGATTGELSKYSTYTLEPGSFRSPIFYDSDNTAYYIDAASTSNLNGLTVAGGNATIYRDLTINGGASGSYGNRIILQGTATTYTLQDTNLRPTVYLTGAYPVLTLNHTVTTNTNHGPTIQFAFNGLTTGGTTSRQILIGANGTATCLDFGFSGGAYGSNSDYNPHNGIAGYSGVTPMRLFSNGLLLGSTGAYPNNITSTSYALDVRGTGYASSDFRSPIFYDSDNTGYYADPASTSVLNRIDLPSGSATINTTTPGQTVYQLNFTGQSTNDNAQAITWGWSTSGAQAGIYVQSSGSYGTKMYIATTDSFATGSKTALTIDHTGIVTTNRNYLQASGSLRAPLFYDSDNTAYYLDPLGTSRLTTLNVNEYYAIGWFRNNSSGNGLYNETTGEHFYSDASDMWNIASANGTQGIRFRTGGYNGTIRGYIYANDSNDVGLLNNSGNWRARVVGGDYFLADGSSIRGQIFYDSNDTGYYIDPNSGSNLVSITNRENLPGGAGTGYNWNGTAISYYWTKIANVGGGDAHAALLITYKTDVNYNPFGLALLSISRFNSSTFSVKLEKLNGDGRQILVRVDNNNDVWLYTEVEWSSYKTWKTISKLGSPTIYYSSVTEQLTTPANSIEIATGQEVRGTQGAATSATVSTVPNNFFGGLTVRSDVRAPIFYDSNNTSYYCDPSSTSNLVGLTVANTITGSISGNAATVTNGMYLSGDQFLSGAKYFTSNKGATSTVGANNTYSLEAYSGDAGAAGMSFHRGGYYAVNMGLDPDNIMRIGGWSASANRWELDMSGNNWVASSFRAPIFYDSNNTSYYVDPASTSSLNALTMTGTITGALDTTASFTGGVCTAASYNYILNGANDGGNKLVIFVNGSTRSADGGVNALTIRNDGGPFVLGQASYLTSVLGSSVTINSNVALHAGNYGGYSSFSGTVYGTAFYSSSDVNYYLQPTNLSNLWTVRANNFYSNQVSVTATASTTINTIYNVTQLTLSASITTLTFSGIQSSTIATMWTVVVLGQGTSYSITWPTAVKWPGGTAPTLTTTLNKRDIYQFLTYDGGTTIYAIIVGQNL